MSKAITGLALLFCFAAHAQQKPPAPTASPLFDMREILDPSTLEIEVLRDEARGIHADGVGLDTEPYTGETSIGAYFRDPPFAPAAHATLAATVREVICQVGQVDYVLPAGSAHRDADRRRADRGPPRSPVERTGSGRPPCGLGCVFLGPAVRRLLRKEQDGVVEMIPR